MTRGKMQRSDTVPAGISRRGFVAAAAAGFAAPPASGAGAPAVGEKDLSPHPTGPAEQRRRRAFDIRRSAALEQGLHPLAAHVSSGDEHLLPERIASFSKGLPHDGRGIVAPAAYQSLLDCLANPNSLNQVAPPPGCPDPQRQRPLVNPLGGFTFEMAGADPQDVTQPPAPRFSSEEAGAEMIELYWQALLRDVPFGEYADSVLAAEAAAELTTNAAFRGPRAAGAITPGTLFRGSTPGDLAGPYVSQFLLKGAPFGAQYVEQRMRCPRPGVDYGTEFDEWLDLQRGCNPIQNLEFETGRRYVRNGRDMAQWVHIDVLYQAYFNAALILTALPDAEDPETGGGIGAPFSPTNPYWHLPLQTGFGSFGSPHVMALLAEVSTHALHAVWFQKWGVHRRLRPEAYGGRVEAQRRGLGEFPIPASLLESVAVERTRLQYGSSLLPLAYPEGCPLHPSYGAGHATVAGACITVLKALFDESFVLPDPVEASPDGQSLVPYTGADAHLLTVGGELNKVAANIAIGRNFAGIHYRSDYWESVKLGEEVAIRLLQDYRLTFAEAFGGFRFTRFDGAAQEV